MRVYIKRHLEGSLRVVCYITVSIYFLYQAFFFFRERERERERDEKQRNKEGRKTKRELYLSPNPVLS